MSPTLLEARRICVDYPVEGRRKLRALDRVDIELGEREVLGVVGESGCGKSTLARAILGFVRLSAGEVRWRGRRADDLEQREFRALRRELQVIFQDPFASLDPRMTIEETVGEPLESFEPALARRERRTRVAQVLERVGLGSQALDRYPHEFSGGQCQRIAIARAVILRPRVVVCDEPVSALDVSVQAQITGLLDGLKQELDMSLLFISHNLAVTRLISDRVLVMYLGRVVETAARDPLFEQPLHPYTRSLLDAVPEPDPRVERKRSRLTLIGEIPSPIERPSGCVFRTRCPLATDLCARQEPPLELVGPSHQVACHRWQEVAAMPWPK